MNIINQYFWDEIKNKVKLVNEPLYQVIEEIDPQNIPFFIAKYDFGVHWGVKNNAYIPTESGRLEKIDSSKTLNYLYQHLGYGKDSMPLGMILDKYCEWHSIGENDRIFPDYIQGPGAIFNMQIVFAEEKTVANNILSVSSGALSAFLLPNIGNKTKHTRLHNYFDISLNPPKSPYEHHLVFKELLYSKYHQSYWQSEILYFSEKFIKKVQQNEKWLKLKLFFSEALRKKIAQKTFDYFSNDLFLSAEKINRFRPSPFIIDTAKYIFSISLGNGIGAKPTIDNQYCPIEDIQKIYTQCYGLEYIPTIIVPSSLIPGETVYYPLQCPYAKINTFRSNSNHSTLTDLENLKNVLLTYQEEFLDENNAAHGSSLYYACKETQFSFYHYQAITNNVIKNAHNLKENDHRFSHSYYGSELKFASDAKLFRGCIGLSR